MMAIIKILCLLLIVALSNRSVSTQDAMETSNGQSELFHFSNSGLLSDGISSSRNKTDVSAVNENYSSSADTQLTTEDTHSGDSKEQIFTRVEKFIHKYIIFTINILSFFCCVLTIIVLQRGALKSSSTVYIRGIAMSSILITMLYSIYSVSFHDSVSQIRAFQNVFSYVFAYGDVFFYISMASNVWIILAFAIERFVAICFPLKSRVISSESRAKKIVAVVFIVAGLMNAPRFFRVAVTIKTDPRTNEILHVWSYTTFGHDPFSTRVIYMSFTILVVIIPFPLLAILNCLIIVKLRMVRHSQMRLKGIEKDPTVDRGDSKQVQIQRVLVASLLAFLFCYTVVASTFVTLAFEGVYALRQFNLEIRLRFLIAPCLFVFNPLLNFILYVMCSKILREDVKRLFCGKFVCHKS